MLYSDYKANLPPHNRQLKNILEENWHEQFILTMACPYCEQISDCNITITKLSIRIDCKNASCSKVFFYRRINLGAIE